LPETTLFFEAVVANRAMLLDDETALEGATTVSLETQPDLVESDILTYIQDNFADFIRALRFLSKEDQELLLSYYVLAKTQTTLAQIHRSTQTLCSARIRMAIQKLGTFMMLGPPTAVVLHESFARNRLEDLLTNNLDDRLIVPLSQVVDLYARTRSFQRVAEVLSIHRPDIRRVMSQAHKVLKDSNETRDRAIGAYLFDLIDKASASGQGFSRRKMAKQGSLYRQDPLILGEFVIDVTSPDFAHVFVSRANR
jgi:hypothetical protein